MKKVLLSLITFVSLQGQTNTEKVHLSFEGNNYYSTNNMLKILDVKSDNVDKNKFEGTYIESLMKKLRAEGCYEEVKVFYDKKKKILTFKLKEKTVITSVKVKNFKEEKSETEISAFLRLNLGSFNDKTKIETAKKIILDNLKSEGFTGSKVEIFVNKKPNNNVEIVIEVEEGFKNIIKEINFSGLTYIREKELQKSMTNKEKTPYLYWMYGFEDGVLNEKELDNDKVRIVQTYYKHGFLDVNVSKLETVIIDNENIKIDVEVNEGQQYILRYITSKTNIFKKEVNEIIAENLTTDKPINVEEFVKTINRIKIFFKDNGYYDVKVSQKIEKGDGKVYVTLEIESNDKYDIGNIIINGNSKTKDNVIRRNIFLAYGDIYSYSLINESKKALMRTGFFKDVIIKEKKIGKSKIEVEFVVVEQSTGALQLGGGYGEYQGLFVKASLSETNLFGSGIGATTEFSKSSKDSNFNLSLINSRIDDSNYSGSASVFYKKFDYPDYSVNSIGTSLSLGKNLSPYTNIYTRYSYNSSEYTDVLKGFEDYFSSYTKSSIHVGYKFDNTNEYYLASEGMRSQTNIEIAGIGGDAKFIKTNFNLDFYFDLTNIFKNDTILRLKNRLGYIYDYGMLPINDKYYLGGAGSVRGYEAFSISPTAKSASNTTMKIGGKYMTTNTIELSTSIYKRNVRLIGFSDFGALANNQADSIVKAGVGVGIEWLSPVGAFKLSLAKPLMYDEKTDRESAFTFGFGSRF